MRFIKKHRFVLGTIFFAIILLIIIVSLFSIDNSTNQMIVDYIESIGWQVDPSPIEISHLTIPNEFDIVYETYNAIQIKAGFDLNEFKGKSVSRYSYKVQNHTKSNEEEVIASVFVYENRIIAGDISSAAINGFMHGITETTNLIADKEL